MADSKRPAKRAKLLTDDTDSESEATSASSLVNETAGAGFKVNEEYARRFEHNKKREEKQRLEEKYGSSGGPGALDDSSDEDSTDESEDDDAELATVDVDEEILATLQAIKRKDPSVYDQNVKFYRDFEVDAANATDKKPEKPMFLRDYHRQNILAGGVKLDEDEDIGDVPQTYQQEQDALKRDLVGAMHAAVDDGEDEDFLVAKPGPKRTIAEPVKAKKITEVDIEEADKDPENFLSNFMAARAWLPTEGSHLQPFESDDSEDDARAEQFEEAYNMRYENPDVANETLRSFARDVGKYSVRREEKRGRKKARDKEREKKEAEKLERDEERARLRRLKLEEAEDKVKRIKHAAGIHGQDVDLDEWRHIIEGDFDDDKWEDEMKRRFGDDYYAQQDEANADLEDGPVQKKSKPTKPKWDDDIAIDDLIPDFNEQDNAALVLSSGDEAQPDPEDDRIADDDADGSEPSKKSITKKDRVREKTEAKRAARKERQKIEEMVDAALPLSHPSLSTASSSKRPVVGFRYRETSPTSFGLTARDILFADDTQLNQFAGLKKMAAFRDAEKKRRDRKKFSKKARLRQWRKDTFGREQEPTGGFETILGVESRRAPAGAEKESSKKRKRSNKKSKTTSQEVA